MCGGGRVKLYALSDNGTCFGCSSSTSTPTLRGVRMRCTMEEYVVNILHIRMILGNQVRGVNEAQAGNIKLSQMFKDKGLEVHPDKTRCFLFEYFQRQYKLTTRSILWRFPCEKKRFRKVLGSNCSF